KVSASASSSAAMVSRKSARLDSGALRLLSKVAEAAAQAWPISLAVASWNIGASTAPLAASAAWNVVVPAAMAVPAINCPALIDILETPLNLRCVLYRLTPRHVLKPGRMTQLFDDETMCERVAIIDENRVVAGNARP